MKFKPRILVFLAGLLAGGAQASAVQSLADEIAAGDHRGIDGLVVMHDGQVFAEGYGERLPAEGRDIRSATKSITALLVGIAIDRGHIGSVDTPVVELLPELADAFADDPRKQAMRLQDLLTMRSGLDCDDWTRGSPGHEDTMYRKRDWLGFWASQPMRDAPGTRFSYCTGNVVALGRILANATGEPVPAFAQKNLFGPLGIQNAAWETWNRGRDTDTGGHLALHPRDLARIGQMVIQRGEFEGQRVVSADWIAAMTTEHTPVPGRSQRYGYLWWLDRARGPKLGDQPVWMAWGNGGNYLFLFPGLRASIAFAGKRYNRPDAMEPMQWMGTRILPELVQAAQVTPGDGDGASGPVRR
ncbi:serine hydrolase domain-containing protein [Arenimonas aestuarii]